MRVLLCAIVLAGSGVFVWAQDSLNMSCVSRFELWDGFNDVAIAGRFAYVTAGHSGLKVFRVRDVLEPELVASLDLGGNANQILCDGSFAYVLDADSGLRVVDIGDPLAPRQAGGNLSFVSDYGPWGLAKDDNLVGFYYGEFGRPWRLAVLDVANPVAPAIYCDVEIEDPCGRLAMRDRMVFYCSSSQHRFKILDISNPAAPVEPGSAPDVGNGCAGDIELRGDYAYVSTQAGMLYVIDISNPAEPVLVVTVPVGNQLRELALTPTHLLASALVSLTILELSDPAQPTIVSRWVSDCPYVGPAAVGPGPLAHVLVHQRCQQLVTLDLSDPDQPQALGCYDRSPAREFTGIERLGDFLCLSFRGNSTRMGGLLVMDATDPANLDVASWRRTNPAGAIALRDTYAYTCSAYFDRHLDDYGEFVAHDLADPFNPQQHEWLETPVAPMQVALSGRYAFLACGDNSGDGLAVIDLQDPAAPALLQFWPWPYSILLDFAIADPWLFVATPDGLRILRADAPQYEGPVETGVALPGETITAVAARGHYVYASGRDSLYTIDVMDPAAPLTICAAAAPAAKQLVVMDDRLYAACSQSGVYVWDISLPEALPFLGYYDTPGWAQAITARDSLIFVADNDNVGVYCLNSPLPADPADITPLPQRLTVAAFPNPFNAEAVIRYEVPAAGTVELAVYDMTGRRVTTLVDAPVRAGSHTVRLDARGMGSGVYFATIRAQRQSAVAKVVLLK